jgi:hypothetical protein
MMARMILQMSLWNKACQRSLRTLGFPQDGGKEGDIRCSEWHFVGMFSAEQAFMCSDLSGMRVD